MNDRHVGGYISLTTHELNINESKYSERSGKFSDSENNNARGRAKRNGDGASRGRMAFSSRGDVDKFSRGDYFGRRGSLRDNGEYSDDDDENGVNSKRNVARNKIDYRPKAQNDSIARKAFRLRKI